jgi:hypothetical protein
LAVALASHPAEAQNAIVYDFGGGPLIEHGDTLRMPLSKEQADSFMAKPMRSYTLDGEHPFPSRIDTLVYLFRPDSVYIVFSGVPYPLHPELAKQMRYMLFVARRDAANPPMSPTVVH